MANIAELINDLKNKGVPEDGIIQELKKQYPEKGKIFEQALERKASSQKIIEEILKQNAILKKEPEENLEQKLQEAKKRIENLKEIKIEEPKTEIEQQFEKKENNEKLDDFLKRRIDSEGEEKAANIPLSQEYSAEEQIPLPEKRSPIARLLLRFLIVFSVIIVLGGITAFWYWYFIIQPSQIKICSADSDCQQGFYCENKSCKQLQITCSADSNCKEGYYCDNKSCKKKEAIISLSEPIFKIDETSSSELTSLDQGKEVIIQKLQEWVNANSFKRIVLIDKTQAKEASLKEFFNMFSIVFPDEFFSKLEDNFTFFVYSQIQGNRIGFASKIKDYQGFEEFLASKEKTFEVDFAPFFDLIKGNSVLAKNKAFKNARDIKSYTGPNFRYKILASSDLGFYYLVYNKEIFVFTTSWKSMEEVIKRLENSQILETPAQNNI